MALRNGEHGYGLVTKALHWVTFAAITGQFVVGYTMDDDVEERENEFVTLDGLPCEATDDTDAAEFREETCEEELERLEEQAEAEADRAEDQVFEDAFDSVTHLELFEGGVSLPELHVALGLFIIGLGIARVLWRRTPLPPWAEALSEAERKLESLLEKAMVALLFLVPATGLLLVLGTDDWLPVHIAAHICFYVAIGLHIGLVLKHTVIRRDRHLARML